MDIHTVAAFVTARLDEEETIARRALFNNGNWTHEFRFGQETRVRLDFGPDVAQGCGTLDASNHAHIARHDPARVLAKVDTQRAIVANMCSLHEAAWQYEDARTDIEYLTLTTVRRLAALDADHPDWNPAWTLKEEA